MEDLGSHEVQHFDLSTLNIVNNRSAYQPGGWNQINCQFIHTLHKPTRDYLKLIYNSIGIEILESSQPTCHNYPIPGRPIHGIPTFTFQVLEWKKLQHCIMAYIFTLFYCSGSPTRFAKIFLPHKPSIIHIQDTDQHGWECKTWRRKNDGHVHAIISGWSRFYKAKFFQNRDMLIFELLHNLPTTFAVYRYRYPTGKLCSV